MPIAGEQARDRVEVAPVCLQRVRGGFSGCAVSKNARNHAGRSVSVRARQGRLVAVIFHA